MNPDAQPTSGAAATGQGVDEGTAQDHVPPNTSEARDGRGRFYALMAVVALLVAGGLALFASSQPDGLERVAIDTGFAESAQDSAVAGSPLADYSLGGAQAEPSQARSAAAGVAGVALMAGVAFAVFGALGRRPSAPAATDQQ